MRPQKLTTCFGCQGNEMRDNETVEDQLEKELYSKVCVVKSIKHVVGETSKEKVDMKEEDRFSLNLATILARDDEVVAVRLYASSVGYKVYLSKNSSWTPDDASYIKKVERYLKTISKYSPATSKVVENAENALIHEIKTYCYTKVKSRFEKLKRDIIGSQEGHIKSFTDFASINVDKIDKIGKEGLYKICKQCYMYYKIAKRDPKAHPKFLGHLKKMGVYVRSVIEIIACANKLGHKTIFSNFELLRMEPTIIADQPTFSWKNIIKRFVDDDEYERFMNKCQKKPFLMERLRKTYTDKVTRQLQLDNGIKRCICLHAEMNILASIIDEKNMNRQFIAVSKSCCYLCELYIDFARKRGYNVIISGTHKKLYDGWKLPHVADNDFKNESLRHLLNNLDLIIENKIKRYARSLLADSDSTTNSVNDDANNVNDSDQNRLFEKF